VNKKPTAHAYLISECGTDTRLDQEPAELQRATGTCTMQHGDAVTIHGVDVQLVVFSALQQLFGERERCVRAEEVQQSGMPAVHRCGECTGQEESVH
jgi:hypothetical protein